MSEAVEILSTSEAYEATTRGEIDVQIATAKRFPRDLTRCLTELKRQVTMSQSIAEECTYAIPRDGKTIDGPSVRFAEMLANSWGNLRVGYRIVGIDDTAVTCCGACHDLERNVAIQCETRRKITGKGGRRYSDDMVNTTALAGCAVAFRNAVLKVVPKALWEDAWKASRQAARKEAQKAPIVDRRKGALEYFKKLGVDRAAVLRVLKRSKISDVTEDDLEQLTFFRNAIREESTTVEEVFGSAPAAAPKPPEPVDEDLPPAADPKEERTLIDRWHDRLASMDWDKQKVLRRKANEHFALVLPPLSKIDDEVIVEWLMGETDGE